MEVEQGSLAQLGFEVLKHFSKLIRVTSQSQEESVSHYQAQSQNEQDRFQLFAANMSLVQNGHSSLDYRLRESDLLRSSVRRLLQDLMDSLEEASQLCAEKQIGESSSAYLDQLPERSDCATENDQDEDELLEAGYGVGTDGDVPAIKLIFESITDAIDRLFRLATKVRNPGTRQIAERVYTYKDVDEVTGINLIDEYAKFDRQHVLQVFDGQSKASPKEPQHYLIERLTQANVLRRQQFGYWRRRHSKLQPVLAFAVGELSLRDPLRPNLDLGTRETTKPRQAVSRVTTSKPYTASMLDPSKIDLNDKKSTISISEYAPTAKGLDNEVIDWPAPPSKLNDKKYFECPYCYTLCPREYLERKAWRAHLLRDLRPYICTYEHCSDAKRLYETRQEWVAHENSIHRRVWRCLEHAKMTFQDRDAYEDHLNLKHLHEAQLHSSQLIRAGESTTNLPDRPCPFCQVDFAKSLDLQIHIAFHLEKIARFALPRSTGIDDESASGENGSADPAGFNEDLQNEQLTIESLSSFSGDSDTLQQKMKDKSNSSGTQTENKGITLAEKVQSLNSSALKLLEGNTFTVGGVNVRQYLQSVATYQQGRSDETEEIKLKVHELQKEVLGEEHPNMLSRMASLASTYRSQGRWKEAEELEMQVMEASKRVLGPEHPNTLSSMSNLATTYRNQGRWKEAEELQVQVMETRKRVLGEEHPNTLSSMSNLASTYMNQGRWKEAEELQVQVMETRKRVLGEEHPNTLSSMSNLASTYRNQGRWKEAEELQVQVMETRKRVLGEEHPNTLSSMSNLASTYRNQGRWKEAEELQVQVMEASLRVLGVEHPNTLGSMSNLASTYMNQGRWKEAEELQVQVMETRKRVLGEEHPNTLSSMSNLASTYRNQGRWKEAEELEVQVMETRKRVLGEEHPDTLSSIADLASTYRNQGRLKKAEELDIIANFRRVRPSLKPPNLGPSERDKQCGGDVMNVIAITIQISEPDAAFFVHMMGRAGFVRFSKYLLRTSGK